MKETPATYTVIVLQGVIEVLGTCKNSFLPPPPYGDFYVFSSYRVISCYCDRGVKRAVHLVGLVILDDNYCRRCRTRKVVTDYEKKEKKKASLLQRAPYP